MKLSDGPLPWVPLSRLSRHRTDKPRERASTVNGKTKLRPAEIQAGTELDLYAEDRPRTRKDCRGGPRPCPWAGCADHLYLDVNENGSIKLNFPHLDVDEIPETCARDLAEAGPRTLEDVGIVMNMSRERVRQIEEKLLDRLWPLMQEMYGLE